MNGFSRTYFINIEVGDVVDLALTPTGPSGDRSDGSDGSYFSMIVDDEVNDTETQENIDSFLNLDKNFMKSFESVKKTGLLITESELLANNFSGLNLRLSRILNDINSVLKKDLDKIIKQTTNDRKNKP